MTEERKCTECGKPLKGRVPDHVLHLMSVCSEHTKKRTVALEYITNGQIFSKKKKAKSDK